MPILSGSLTLISGSLEIPSGSLIGTASYATSAEQLSGVQTTIVNISSAQILTLSNFHDLLPDPDAGKYIEVQKVLLEYTHVSTPYTFANDFIQLAMPYGNICNIDTTLITSSTNKIAVVYPSAVYSDGSGNVYATSYAMLNGYGLSIGSFNGDPTDGDGTIRAIITYTIRTFGT